MTPLAPRPGVLAAIRRGVLYAVAGCEPDGRPVVRSFHGKLKHPAPRRADGRRWQRSFTPAECAALLLWDWLGVLPVEMAEMLDHGRGAIRSKLHRLKQDPGREAVFGVPEAFAPVELPGCTPAAVARAWARLGLTKERGGDAAGR